MIDVHPDDIVIIAAFDDVPEHLFRVEEVYDDCITGQALTGPLAGEYGEPPIELIRGVHLSAD
ncbi:hypothetical protein [Celeribacter persicus]|uniref:Uncharacterized protein n=1 Tax=Celeribacter persicus TaxID=1651082 RepID=A0A2T5GN59_9RHOB|nr:hypothetical protein [Celeribacter persicus]PTQ60737.1 hypothetical protein C8N42_1702 [Celeribacter persicus]